MLSNYIGIILISVFYFQFFVIRLSFYAVKKNINVLVNNENLTLVIPAKFESTTLPMF